MPSISVFVAILERYLVHIYLIYLCVAVLAYVCGLCRRNTAGKPGWRDSKNRGHIETVLIDGTKVCVSF